jgi:nitroimidazol reductase NimA-like FMN-containing flavoprotein (pyridoxamine 5'-phosphate oxidase superfamily)
MALTSAQVEIEILKRDECLAAMRTVPVGRIGLTFEGLPLILPVNFTIVEDSILFRTAVGTKLDIAWSGAMVAFEVDRYEADGSMGWSVLAIGQASEITDPRELERVRSVPIRPWVAPDAASHLIRVDTTILTGRRFSQLEVPPRSG